MFCRVCKHTDSTLLESEFFRCLNCDAILRIEEKLADSVKEKIRYEKHQNSKENQGYLNFLSPVFNYIVQNISPTSIGLDYGCGPNPVLANLLKDKGYSLNLYDPFFYTDAHVLGMEYDFIICTEVVEHFHNPYQEFERLSKLLNREGILLIMTELHLPALDFKNWYYKNDFTHVVFYSEKTFAFIAKHFGFEVLELKERLIILKKQ